MDTIKEYITHRNLRENQILGIISGDGKNYRSVCSWEIVEVYLFVKTMCQNSIMHYVYFVITGIVYRNSILCEIFGSVECNKSSKETKRRG